MSLRKEHKEETIKIKSQEEQDKLMKSRMKLAKEEIDKVVEKAVNGIVVVIISATEEKMTCVEHGCGARDFRLQAAETLNELLERWIKSIAEKESKKISDVVMAIKKARPGGTNN